MSPNHERVVSKSRDLFLLRGCLSLKGVPFCRVPHCRVPSCRVPSCRVPICRVLKYRVPFCQGVFL